MSTRAVSYTHLPAVNLILRIQKMDVTGGHHGFPQLFAQVHDLSVHVLSLIHISKFHNESPFFCVNLYRYYSKSKVRSKLN